MPLSMLSVIFNDIKFTCIVQSMLLLILLLSLFKIVFNSNPSRRVYLIDFACFKPDISQQITRDEVIEHLTRHVKNFTEESIEFQRKVIMACGIGDMTYAPEPFLKDPPDFSMEGARREAEAAIYGAVDALLVKTEAKAEQIGVLIVCGGLFNPVPSLSAMIVNKYKLRNDIKSFNLSGMGCCASIAAIGLAKHLLQVHENMYAMVVSTEVIGQNAYTGNDIDKLIVNCVFRVGGAAVLLSNRPSDRRSSKYELIHTVRTNNASSDTSYRCLFHEEDSQGLLGFTVTSDLIAEARKAITAHITILAKLVLPTSDKILFLLNYLIRKLHLANLKPYKPDFRRAIDHFFPHVGGSSVIDEVERNLKLDVEAPRMTLYRFGNSSSSSVWYELAYAEAKKRIKRGDRVWQFAYGSGFKCSSVILHAMKSVDQEKINPWFDEIDNFPGEQHFGQLPSYFKDTE